MKVNVADVLRAEMLERYRELCRRPYLDRAHTARVRAQVSALRKRFAIGDRRVVPLEPDPQPEQLALEIV